MHCMHTHAFVALPTQPEDTMMALCSQLSLQCYRNTCLFDHNQVCRSQLLVCLVPAGLACLIVKMKFIYELVCNTFGTHYGVCILSV